jgi:hypothetical protein
VGVFYDPSVAKHSGKPYRYTHYPVFVPGSLFHAKNILAIFAHPLEKVKISNR